MTAPADEAILAAIRERESARTAYAELLCRGLVERHGSTAPALILAVRPRLIRYNARVSGSPEMSPDREPTLGWLSLPAMRYPNTYVWFVLVSTLDIMLTWTILHRGGSEVNPVARAVIDLWGLPGAIAFKYALMLVVIMICEIVGRRRDLSGRLLSQAAVAVSAMPVAYSFLLLLIHGMAPAEQI